MTMKNHKKIILLTTSLLVFGTVLFGNFAAAHAYTIEPLYKVLQTNDNIKNVWTQVRNIINVVIIAVLIFIAFANILRINLNNYAVKKFLPALVFGVILANFSYFICIVCVDLANVAMSLLMNGASGAANDCVGSGKVGVAGAFDFSSAKVDPNNMGRSFVYIIFEIIGAVFVYILSILFFVRNYIIYFLVSLSPLAFMATVLPETKSVFKQWMSMFMKWTFMPIVSLFWLWVGGMWWMSGFNPSGGSTGCAATNTVNTGDFNSSLFGVVFAGVCYYLALTTPFKMGGDIMSKWSSGVKNTGKWVGRQANDLHGDFQARAQRNQKNSTGWKKALWGGVGNTLAATNYQTYKKAWGARQTARTAARDKAISKSDLYNRIAGPLAQIEAARDRELDDYEFASPASLGRDAQAGLDAIIAAYNGGTLNNSLLQAKIKKIMDDLTAGGATPTRGAVRDALMRRILGMNTQEIADNFQGSGVSFRDSNGDVNISSDNNGIGKMVALFRSTNKARRQRGGDVIDPVFASSAVVDPEVLTPEGVGAARAAANGGQVPETNISRESIEALAEAETSERESLVDEIEHDATVADTVNARLRDADFIAGQQGRDGLAEAQTHMAQMKDSAALGLEKLADTDPNTRNSSIAAAVEAAKSISGSFETSLKAHEDDPERMAEELGKIFTSTQKEVSRLEASDLAGELDKYSQSSNWKRERIQGEMQTVPQQAELRAVNSAFASSVGNLQEASIDQLQTELGKHIDMLVESNEDIRSVLESNPDSLNISGLKTEIRDQINQSIVSKQSAAASSAADPTSKLRESMVAALTDPSVNKRLAHTFQSASEMALKSAPKPVIDVKAPSGPSNPNPPAQGGL